MNASKLQWLIFIDNDVVARMQRLFQISSNLNASGIPYSEWHLQPDDSD